MVKGFVQGVVRLAPAFVLLALALYVAGAQPWMGREAYSAPYSPTTDFEGWSTMDGGGALRLHIRAEGVSAPRVVEVRLEDGGRCAIVNGTAVDGESDVYAECGKGGAGEPYNGTVMIEYRKGEGAGTAVGYFEGWRS